MKRISKIISILILCVAFTTTASAALFTTTAPRFGGYSPLSSTEYKGGSDYSGYMVTSTATLLNLYGEFDKYVNGNLRMVSDDIYRINYSENFSYSSRTDVPYANEYLQGSFYCGMRVKTSSIEPNNIDVAVSWRPHW